MERTPYLRCGQIINTHGVRGAVKARSECDSPEILRSLSRIYTAARGEYVERMIVSASVQKGFVLLRLEGVDTVEDANALRGEIIYASREELSKFLAPGDRFIADLIGMRVVNDETGERIGTLSDVTNAGASDIYVVDTPNGERMMPAVPEFIAEITDEEIRVLPIEGMFD